MQEYDILILGAGSGGYSAALRAAQLGMSVALFEKDKLGGTCLHRGCIPTKALLQAAHVADTVREASHWGVQASLDTIDMASVAAFRQATVNKLYKGLTGLVGAKPITLISGHATLTSDKTIESNSVTYQARRGVILATGSVPKVPQGLNLSDRIVTSDQILELTSIPSSIIILGGGVIGVEFASIFTSFGSKVTILEALPTLVPNEDETISAALKRALVKRGVQVKTGVRMLSASDDGQVARVQLEDGQDLQADIVLLAVGRGPSTSGCGLESAGIFMDRGYVPTDEQLRTNIPGIYAVGDIVPGVQLAHRGFAHGIFVAEHIAGLSPRPVLDHLIPKVTYCEPEIASIGLSHKNALEKFGDSVRTYEYNLAGNGKSQILNATGFIKLVAAPDGTIVGVHMIGSRAAELIGEAQLIVSWEADAHDVASLVHAHPTQNEALGEAFLALAGKPLHAHS